MSQEIAANEDPDKSGPEILEIMVKRSAGVPITNLVINDVIKISNEMPANANQVSPSFADYLAGRFLIGINLCGELAAFAAGHTLRMLSMKKKEYATAYHVRSIQNGCKAVKDKEHYSFMDSEYLAADANYIEAVVFEKMVDDKRDVMQKAHYHMRKLADKDPDSGYTESRTEQQTINRVVRNDSSESVNKDKVDDWDNVFK